MRRITTPFGFSSTAAEVVQGVDLVGKRAIVTGGASGIGIETARALALAGAAVTLAVRRPDAASVVAEEIRTSTGNCAVDVRPLDLADITSVRRFCADWTAALHILVNNAGIMALHFLLYAKFAALASHQDYPRSDLGNSCGAPNRAINPCEPSPRWENLHSALDFFAAGGLSAT